MKRTDKNQDFPKVITGYASHAATAVMADMVVDNALSMYGSTRNNHVFRCGWALAFCGGRHSPETFLKGLRRRLGDITVFGGSCAGVISRYGSGYTGFEGGVILFQESLPVPVPIVQSGLDSDEMEAGRYIGWMMRVLPENSSCMIFYDSVKDAGPPPQLHVASLIMNGIHETLARDDIRIFGAGTIGDFMLSDSWIFDGQGIRKNSVCVIPLPEEWEISTAISHGCVSVSGFFKITRIEGPRVYELDGKPALEVIKEMFRSAENFTVDSIPLSVTLGSKQGDPYAPDMEAAYVNRLIVATDEKDGALILFEADFREGDSVQIMARDNGLMIDSARQCAEKLKKKLNDDKDSFLFYVDCAGRAADYCGSAEEESRAVIESLADNVPLLGFYSGVEIAPVSGFSRPLDWTAVLALVNL